MVQPPQSPDLIIMESVRGYIEREKTLRQTKSKSTEELSQVVQDALNNPPAKYCEILLAGVPQRIGAVL